MKKYENNMKLMCTARAGPKLGLGPGPGPGPKFAGPWPWPGPALALARVRAQGPGPGSGPSVHLLVQPTFKSDDQPFKVSTDVLKVTTSH